MSAPIPLPVASPHTRLTLYYDGNCPFCLAEMKRMASWNHAGYLAFIDIATPGFDPALLGTDMAALNLQLHSQTADGTLLVGIDSMLAAYPLVGKGWMVWPLRVGWLRPLLGYLYRQFARNRYRISAWLGYRPVVRCEAGVCQVGNPFLRERP
jgi:predicted DCC family thiol-disulfide oxidoreductase YuxK